MRLVVGGPVARRSCLSSRMHPPRPRAQAMTRVSAIPANSHGATSAIVIAVPSATDSTTFPVAVAAFTTSSVMPNSSGGTIATISRSPGLT